MLAGPIPVGIEANTARKDMLASHCRRYHWLLDNPVEPFPNRFCRSTVKPEYVFIQVTLQILFLEASLKGAENQALY